MLSQLRKLISHSAVDLLLPKSCFACTCVLPEGREDPLGLCSDCQRDLLLLDGECCRRCAAPVVVVGDDKALPCHRCRDLRLHFDEALAAGEYEGLLRHLTLRAKRASEEATSLGLGRLMWQHAAPRLTELAPDAVAVVPMHWRRRLVRQTNAPEIMAEPIARGLKIPLAPRLLKRLRSTVPQPSLARSQRLPNVRRAFAVRRGFGIEGATIVLIDDILTTGSTCSEAARALKQAGAARVVVVVAAKSL